MKKILAKEQIDIFLNAFEQTKGKKTVFIDMDGVVADFEKAMNEHSDIMNISPEEFSNKKLYRDIQGFYLNLEVIPGSIDVIRKLDEVYDVIFLSAPSWGNIHCFTEKRIWIEKHFGELSRKKMDLSFHKGHYIGHYLIDDRTKYGAGDFIGEHIMFGTAPFNTWKEIEKYLVK